MNQQNYIADALAILCSVLSGCSHPRTSIVPDGQTGSLIVIASDSTGEPRQSANVYFAEDLRITNKTILQRQAGAWTDERGVASLGSWRPGHYTLVVHAIGFKKQVLPITIVDGQTDTLKVSLRILTLLLDEAKKQQ